MAVNMDICGNLRRLRENCNLTANDVSEILLKNYGINMNYRTLYNYENGKSSPDIERFIALCEIYGCNRLSSFNPGTSPVDGGEFEEFVIFQDEYTPENWQMIKNFLSLIPKIPEDLQK